MSKIPLKTYKFQHIHLPLGTEYQVVTNETGIIIKFPLAAAVESKPGDNDNGCWSRIKSRIWIQSSHNLIMSDILMYCEVYGRVVKSFHVDTNIIVVEFEDKWAAREAVIGLHKKKVGDRKLYVSH